MAVQLSPTESLDTSSRVGWTRTPVKSIDDLADAVHGAGLRAVQLSRARVAGSLVYAESDGITYSSGFIDGRVQLIGSLSESDVTFGIGLNMAPGSKQWFSEVADGAIGQYMAGDEHDALQSPGALYAAITLSEERAEEMGASFDRVLEARKLGGSSVYPGTVSPSDLRELQLGFKLLHATGTDSMRVGQLLRRVLIEQVGRAPVAMYSGLDYRGRSKIVRRCREYIDENLHESLSMEALAEATGTSTRTLFRSFTEVLGETPLYYVRQLRLHRIRHDLLTSIDAERTVTAIANRWGVTELGRFAGWYSDMFGERPSQTISHARQPSGKFLGLG
jgi:AraC-like DNA-binding protein